MGDALAHGRAAGSQDRGRGLGHVVDQKGQMHDARRIGGQGRSSRHLGMDILNTLGNAADNILTGQNKGLTVSEFESLWRDGGDDIYFLDCREWGDAGKIVEGHPDRWHNIPQGELRERLAEVPRDKKIVLMLDTNQSFDTANQVDDELDFYFLTLPITGTGFKATPWTVVGVAGKYTGYYTAYASSFAHGHQDRPAEHLRHPERRTAEGS